MNPARRTHFPIDRACYAFLTSYFLVPLFVFGSLLIAVLPHKEPDLLTRRIARLGIFIHAATTNSPGSVMLMWGGGFIGHCGFEIGPTNFISYRDGHKWKDGVYFWTDPRSN